MVSDNTRHLAREIKNRIKSDGVRCQTLNDLLSVAAHAFKEENDSKWARKVTKYIKDCCVYGIRNSIEILQLDELYWRTMRTEAPYLFEPFMLYMEKNRPPEERFYEPRIKPLQQVAMAVQELADDELDELFINMPSRVGKTQIVKFAFLWWGSRNPETSNLYTVFSDKITGAFYNGLVELINDGTYTYHEIFPDNVIKRTNGEDETIDLVRVKTYPTFTCRSIYGTLNGSCDCNGLGVADDLLSGIDEAISPDRLETVWGKFDNNFMKRLKRKAKLINMGTRWALKDPQGRRLELMETRAEYRNRRYKIISVPALDENDESNFDYPYDVGYSTEDYRMIRASFEENDDMASWFAQDQQTPIERQGALFTSDDMHFFNPECDMPDREPDRIFMAVDEAFGGGDYVAAPICYQFDEAYYIVDAIFDNGDKKVTQPQIADKIIEHQVQAVCFEETKATVDYREKVEEILKEKQFRTNAYGRTTPGNLGKRTRIFDKAPEIREMYFVDAEHRSKPYQKFMQNLYSFKMEGKVKHDDAPDSMAQLCCMKFNTIEKAQIINSPI